MYKFKKYSRKDVPEDVKETVVFLIEHDIIDTTFNECGE